MFACLYSLSTPVTALVKIAEEFTPRFEVVGPLVMLDVGGLSRLFGGPQEIGEQLRRASSGPVRIALAPTQTAAALLVMGRAGLSVVQPGDQPSALAPLPVSVLADFDRQRLAATAADSRSATVPDPRSLAAGTRPVPGTPNPVPGLISPFVAPFEDTLPYFQQSCMDRASSAAIETHCGAGVPNAVAALATPGGGGWMHPRDSHAAHLTRRARREVTAPPDAEHPHAATTALAAPTSVVTGGRARHSARGLAEIQGLADTLRRWGVKTCGALAALPAGEVYERLGARGVLWQRLARGEDTNPLVPWIPEDPFEASLELEWPLEGLEPLSFVLGRLFDPLSERLERADRGAAIVHTHLRLVNKEVHARTLQLPAPMRDAKTLRTLVLLDLESNPPAAGVDRVRVLVEPTPARVVQWALFERAQASPEQVSTLLARLTALMGEGRVGSPRLLDTWKPGAFALDPFVVQDHTHAIQQQAQERSQEKTNAPVNAATPASALRRFRLPVPARVQMQDGCPVRVATDRRGVTGGAVVQAAGPWRTSGEWWNDAPTRQTAAACQTDSTRQTYQTNWDRDEWDLALHDGTVYRVYVERDLGQWFIEGTID
jgi:protein ImuB